MLFQVYRTSRRPSLQDQRSSDLAFEDIRADDFGRAIVHFAGAESEPIYPSQQQNRMTVPPDYPLPGCLDMSWPPKSHSQGSSSTQCCWNLDVEVAVVSELGADNAAGVYHRSLPTKQMGQSRSCRWYTESNPPTSSQEIPKRGSASEVTFRRRLDGLAICEEVDRLGLVIL